MKAIIVDDEAVAAAALKRRITWNKYGVEEIKEASSMRQAIEILTNEKIELMLCDVEMPGGSGLDLYEWVRIYSPWTECIFVSCHPEYEYVRKALTMGSMDYVLKPVDYEELDVILTNAAARIEERKKNALITETDKTASSKVINKGIWSKQVPDTVNDAVKYIQDNLSQNMSITEIADIVHLNPQYFMRLFKKETGKPVLEFITELRLERVKQLLVETNKSITEIAISAGYDNFSYFSKLFKKYEGVTPSEYRKDR